MKLSSLTRKEWIFPDLKGTDVDSVLGEFAGHLQEAGVVASAAALKDKLLEREHLGSTGIGNGIAIPHCKLSGLGNVVVAIGRSDAGVEFRSLDSRKVHTFFVVLSPPEAATEHLQALAKISKLIKKTEAQDRIRAESDPQAIYDLLEREEQKVL